MKTTSFTQAAIFVYFTGAHVSEIWVLGKWLTNQTKVSFVPLLSSERKLRKNALCLNQSAFGNFALYVISICNRMRPSRIKENFENTSENLSLILLGLMRLLVYNIEGKIFWKLFIARRNTIRRRHSQ